MTQLKKVLIVDASKVVRASLAKYLKGHFRVCEESNGESAWQTLVLDSSIVAVISAHHLAKLDGLGLAERMRSNKLCRLNKMPLFMLVSDSFSAADQAQASRGGVSGFVPKGLAAAEMISLINQLLAQMLPAVGQQEPAGLQASAPLSGAAVNIQDYSGVQSDIGVGDILGQIGGLADDAGEAPVQDVAAVNAFPCRRQVEERLLELLPSSGQGQPVGVLVFGLDGYDALINGYGEELAAKVALKFSGLLARKIRADDCIGQLAPGRIAIVAPHTDRVLCISFAERVCKALAAAQISLHGQRVALTVSVGVATLPEDGVSLAGPDLLLLANGRLDAARRAGGNQVACAKGKVLPEIKREEFLARLKELLAGTAAEAMTPCLGNVGLQIMPILNQIEQAFNFGLPIEDMNRRLWARARAERMMM